MKAADFLEAPDERFVSPAEQAARDQERLRIVQSEFDAETEPATKAALGRELGRIQPGASATGVSAATRESAAGFLDSADDLLDLLPQASPAAAYLGEHGSRKSLDPSAPKAPRRGGNRAELPSPFVAGAVLPPTGAGGGRGFVEPPLAEDYGREDAAGTPMAPETAQQLRAATNPFAGDWSAKNDLLAGVENVKGIAAGARTFPATMRYARALQDMDDAASVEAGRAPTGRDPMGAQSPWAVAYRQSGPQEREAMRGEVLASMAGDREFIAESVKQIQGYQQAAQKLTGKIPDFTDIGSVNDFGVWLARNGINATPTMVASMIGAAAGPLGLAATSMATAVGDMTQERANFAGQAFDPQRFRNNPDRFDDATAAQQDLQARHLAGAAGSTALLAPIYAAGDTALGPAAALARGIGRPVAAGTVRGVLGQEARRMPGQALEEAVAEGPIQGGVNIAAATMAGERPAELTGEDAKSLLNQAMAGAAGAPGGTVIGGGVNAARVAKENRDLRRAAEDGDIGAAAELYARQRPTQRRQALNERLDEFAAQHGMSSKAVKALKEGAEKQPLDTAPDYVKRAITAYQRRGLIGRAVTDEDLTALDEPPPPWAMDMPPDSPFGPEWSIGDPPAPQGMQAPQSAAGFLDDEPRLFGDDDAARPHGSDQDAGAWPVDPGRGGRLPDLVAGPDELDGNALRVAQQGTRSEGADGLQAAGFGPSGDALGARTGARVLARAGRSAGTATDLELRPNGDGSLTPYLGSEPLIDYETTEPIRLDARVTDLEAKQAIRAARAVPDTINFFPARQAPARAPAVGDRVDIGSEIYTIANVNAGAVSLRGSRGETRMVSFDSPTWATARPVRVATKPAAARREPLVHRVEQPRQPARAPARATGEQATALRQRVGTLEHLQRSLADGASLTTGLRKAGKVADKMAVIDRARELRSQGKKAGEAARQAVTEQIAALRSQLGEPAQDSAPRFARQEPLDDLIARISRDGITSPDDLRALLDRPGFSLRARSPAARNMDAATAIQRDLGAAFGVVNAPSFDLDQGLVTVRPEWLAHWADRDRTERLIAIADRHGAPIVVRGGGRIENLRPLGFVPYFGVSEQRGRPPSALIRYIRPAGGITVYTPLFSTDSAQNGGRNADRQDTQQDPDDRIGLLNRAVARTERGAGADRVLPYVAGSVPGDEALGRIAEAFGQHVAWFDLRADLLAHQRRTYGFFNGAYIDGTMYVRASGNDRPHLAILGHEFAHRLRAQRPDLYEQLVEAVRPYVRQERYPEFVRSAVARDAGNANKQREEFIGEVFSDGFMDHGFWRAVGRKNPSLLSRLVDFIGSLIDDFKARLGHVPRTARYLSDFDRVMEIAGEVLGEFGLRSDATNAAPDAEFQASERNGHEPRATDPGPAERAGRTLADYRGLALQALGRRQFVDLYADDIPQLKVYSDLVQRMDAEKNDAGAQADGIASAWAKVKDERQLAALMHDATLAGVDAAEDKASALHARFEALSPAAQDIYLQARDAYREHFAKVEWALGDRIRRADMSSERRQRLLQRLADNFKELTEGVYFPLARFGDYLVIVRDGSGEAISVSRAETLNEADALRRSLVRQFKDEPGTTVGKVLKSREFSAKSEVVSTGFLGELYQTLDKAGVSDNGLMDDIGQLYLSSLPDLSWAKHGIHRKKMPGFSQDARRAFASYMWHGASHLAKLRYADQLQGQLDAMQKHVDGKAEVADYDSVKAQQVVDEMVKRHDLLMNPNTHPLSTALTSIGFVFHLGLSPASAMVNLAQTPLVAFPLAGAKWGYALASKEFSKATAEMAAHGGGLDKALSGDEADAYREAVRIGLIDKTLAHDLAGVSEGEDAKVHGKLRPVMRAASWMFHHAERINREVTFLAAYRMARRTGADAKGALEQATQFTWDSHFDYSGSNRPRIMQGNWQRVILLFQQFAQNMVYTLARQADLSLHAAAPAERARARKALAGLLVMHAAAAGVLGLPVVSTLLDVASWFGSDDDEPWDAETALRNMLADTFGQKTAEVMARGVSRLTPWDISGRVGLDRLILPDVYEGLEGARAVEAWFASALGPVAGIAVNVGKGLEDISKGRWLLGLEQMMPAALRGPMRAYRYATEGAKDRSGVPIVDEVSPAAVAGQALGLSPSAVRNAQEGRAAIFAADRAIEERRRKLINDYAQAEMGEDEKAFDRAQAAIDRWNDMQPDREIEDADLLRSIRAREKRIEEAEGGVYLPASRESAREAGRFARQAPTDDAEALANEEDE